MKSKAVQILLPILAFLFSLFTGCARSMPVPSVWADDRVADYSIEIKNIALKYALVDTAYQIYAVFAMDDSWRREYYARQIPETLRWMESSWNSFSPQMRADLAYCMKKQHPWGVLQYLTAIPDDAGIDEILERIDRSSWPSGFRRRFVRFYRAFYDDFYAERFVLLRAAFVPQVEELEKQSREFTFGEGKNICDYMEEKTGLLFSARRKPVLYLLEFPIGAYGFTTPNRKISTVQAGADDLRILYATAFHEYAHELFRPIEKSPEFRAQARKMKKDKDLFASWDANLRRSYSWNGYIAENVVNGISYYLMYEYAHKTQIAGDYAFDADLSRYLSDLPFDPRAMTLKDVVIGYLTTAKARGF